MIGRRGDAPAHPERRRRRVIAGALAGTVLAVGVLFVAAAPVNTYRTQQQTTADAQAELAEVKAERARVQAETALLETDAEIERRAREDFGFQRPGEETYNILPAPTEPIGLPDVWPFTGAERALGG